MTPRRRILVASLVALVGTVALLGGMEIVSSIWSQPGATRDEAQAVPRYAGPPLRVSPASIDPTTTSTTTTTRPAVATATVVRDSCANSWDQPRCGNAYWYPPVANQPAHLSVTISPDQPVEGEPVTFTFVWSDADADMSDFSFCDGVSGCAYANAASACGKHPTGPWTPPAVRPQLRSITKTAIYPSSGTYHWDAVVTTYSSSYLELHEREPCLTLADPYASGAELERVAIDVAPARRPSPPHAGPEELAPLQGTTASTRSPR
jgi:hypothetical protein